MRKPVSAQGICDPGRRSIALIGNSRLDTEIRADRTSPFKRIRRIEFADLPKTVSGKSGGWTCAARSWRVS